MCIRDSFIDAHAEQIALSKELGAGAIELHTGTYANTSGAEREKQLELLTEGTQLGKNAGLAVHAGHGLTYSNVLPVARIADMEELNIGHSIVARSIFVGFQQAVREMKELCSSAGNR